MDGGIDTTKSENLGFHGPFASVSVRSPIVTPSRSSALSPAQHLDNFPSLEKGEALHGFAHDLSPLAVSPNGVNCTGNSGAITWARRRNIPTDGAYLVRNIIARDSSARSER